MHDMIYTFSMASPNTHVPLTNQTMMRMEQMKMKAQEIKESSLFAGSRMTRHLGCRKIQKRTTKRDNNF